MNGKVQLVCEQIERELDDYLDGELPPERMAAVVHHLATCESCAAQVRFETSVVDELKSRLRSVAAPTELRSRVRETVRGGCDRPTPAG